MINAKFSEGQCFEPQYKHDKRNNNEKGRKDLKCFPQCRSTGHLAGSYCGRPVHCDVSYDLNVQFSHGFKPSYIRNNKSKAKKHMRCFPHCKESGHTTSGFCGQGVQISCSSEAFDSEELKERLLVLGELRCSLEQQRCVVGQEYPYSTIQGFIDDHHII
jgi:hypothetical protein